MSDNPTRYDKNVSPNWKSVETLERHPPRLTWSDRCWFWLLSLAGLTVIGLGVLVMIYLRWGKIGGLLVGVGLFIFAIGPSQAMRNGYRDW